MGWQDVLKQRKRPLLGRPPLWYLLPLIALRSRPIDASHCRAADTGGDIGIHVAVVSRAVAVIRRRAEVHEYLLVVALLRHDQFDTVIRSLKLLPNII